ncbi:MAG: right-handed parallel beta-helix repeat-containing protein, partial [Planctomycetota bacterium]
MKLKTSAGTYSAALLLAIFLNTAAGARIITVDYDAPADFDNIQAAINDANDGDTVEVRPGIYTGDGNRDIDFLGKAITVCGTDANDPNGVAATMIDCQGTEADPHRGFIFQNEEGASSVLSGLTIANGYGPDELIAPTFTTSAGGGIMCKSTSPTISNCVLRGNEANYGSTILVIYSGATINNCTVTDNWGYITGAVLCVDSSAVISGCSVTNNAGGGVVCGSFGKTVIVDSMFSGNSTAIEARLRSHLTVTNCTIRDNDVGIYCNQECTASITGCIIADSRDGYGLEFDLQRHSTVSSCIITGNHDGGIYCYRSDVAITNSTINDNDAGNKHADGIDVLLSDIVVTNCIMRGNADRQAQVWSGASLIVSYSNIEGGYRDIAVDPNGTMQWGPGSIDVDPLLDADYRLTALSPCVNMGDPNYPDMEGESDIDGEPRVTVGRIDIGADEFYSEGPVLHISPNLWEFSAEQRGPAPEAKTLFVQNIGGGAVNWGISHSCSWLEATPTSGQSSGERDSVILSADISSVPIGTHSCELIVSGDPASNSPVALSITLHVLDSNISLDVPSEYPTIQSAIDNSHDGDTIVIDDGVYTGPGNRDIDFKGKLITVKSRNGPANCIIDCNGTEEDYHRGFYFHNGEGNDAVVDGFTVTNGYIGYEGNNGGAVRCAESSPTIANCIFKSNFGGTRGGAIIMYDSSPVISNCVFAENSASDGGAIQNFDSSPVIVNCIFKNNSASCWGGAIRSVYDMGSVIANCLFIGNDGACNGGAISNFKGSPQIINCTFTENSAGVIWNSDKARALIYNSILWRNGKPQIYGAGVANVSFSNIEGGWPGVGNIDADPCFAHIGYMFDPCTPGEPGDDIRIPSYYHLLPGSPCIDAGDNTAVPAVLPLCSKDLDGNPRFGDDPCTVDTGNGTSPIVDMGAYEGPRGLIFFVPSTESVIVPEGGTAEFTVALSSEITEPLEATVTAYYGDPDITVKGGSVLSFDANNYSKPQTVTLQAAEDDFFHEGTAYIGIEANYCITKVVTVTEADNEPVKNILYVDQNAPGANDGTSWEHAYTNLETAIEAAESLPGIIDEILVAQGRYTPAAPYSGDSEASFKLVSGVAIKGGYAGYGRADPYGRDIRKYETILSGDINGDDGLHPATTYDNSETVVFADATDEPASLDGFTITQGRGGYGGGGMAVDSGSPYNRSCPVVVRNCTIIANRAPRGGGIYVRFDSSLEIENCTITMNYADYGGGVYCSDYSSLTIADSTITGNRSVYSGAGCYFEWGNVAIKACTITGNMIMEEEGRGGGIICYSSNAVVSNSILWDNSWADDPEVILSNRWFEPAKFSILHSLIEGGEDSIIVDEGCTLDWGVGNIDGDPCFANSGYWHPNRDPDDHKDDIWFGGDYHLKSEYGRWDVNEGRWTIDEWTSFCIDAGDPNADWRGELWPHGERINMGAYGGTAQASMSPNDVGNVADLDLDGFVYRTDLPLLANEWLNEAVPLREDITRDGIVTLGDFSVLAQNWELPPLPAQASLLEPLDGAVGISRTPVLSWVSDANAVWHGVYLGTESPGVFQTYISARTFEPDVLGRKGGVLATSFMPDILE